MARKEGPDYGFISEPPVALKELAEVPVTGLRCVPDPYPVGAIQMQLKDHQLQVGVDHAFDPVPMTEDAFVGICRALGFPYSYARRIESDLLLHNINRLRVTSPGTAVFFRGKDDGYVRNVVRRPAPICDLGEIAQTVGAAFAGWDVRAIHLTTVGLQVDLITPDLSTEIRDDDVMRLGFRLFASDVGEKTGLEFLSLRHSCYNSAVHDKSMSIAYDAAPYSKDSFNLFLKGGQEVLKVHGGSIFSAIRALVGLYLTDVEMTHVWGKLRSTAVSDETEAQSVLGLGEHDVQNWRKAIHDRKKKFATTGEVVAAAPTNLMAYDVWNSLTRCARDLVEKAPRRAHSLQQLSGSLLKKWLEDHRN